MKSKRKQGSCGGRWSYQCPACQNKDRDKMTLGQRMAYAECDCGYVWDAETGKGFYKHAPKTVEIDLSTLGK